jgi:hypothetical protein
MSDLLSQLRALDSKRVNLEATIRQTQARVRASGAQDERAVKRHAEEVPASATPAVASSVTLANSSPNALASESRRLSSPRDKQVIAQHRRCAGPSRRDSEPVFSCI